jgi:glycosyltransferase involved in cell wall biosynthesis
MRVAVDARSLRAPGSGRGIAVYLERLLAELDRHEGPNHFETVVDTRAQRVVAALVGRPRLDRMAGGADVAWAPAPAPLALSAGVPLVLTLHDLSFEHRPSDYGAYARVWHALARPRRLARRATRVIAVSEAVRREAIAEWGLEPERVVTVLSGPGRPPGTRAPLPDGLAPGCVLAVGALEPRKRPDLLLEAHRRAREQGLRAELVVAGAGKAPSARSGGGPAAAGGGAQSALPAAAARFLGRVDDSTLDALYAEALVLACPSREEGFGFTPLEAAARGTPAVVADLAPFRETLGEAALAVPPGDADALAGALLRLEREPERRERLAAAGRAAVERLSWERAARETRAVLAAAAEERR